MIIMAPNGPKRLEGSVASLLRRARLLMLMSLFWSVIFIVFLLVLGSRLGGLGTEVNISGEVMDGQGNPVPHAKIIIAGITENITTNKTGFFSVHNVETGDTTLELRYNGSLRQVHLLTTYNIFNEQDRTYHLEFVIENGTGVVESGGLSSSRMKNYCTGFTLFFSVTTISQVLAILALRNGRNRHAKIMCVIGMLSFGFGLSTLLLGNALINIHKADTNIRMAKELASKNVEQN